MPIYAYRCASCGHSRDVLQKISDPVLSVCPACGADQFQKQVTAAGFQLKGSGWYVTDFRNSGSGSAGASAGASAPAAGSATGESGTAAPAPAPAPSSPTGSASATPSAGGGGGACGGGCACH